MRPTLLIWLTAALHHRLRVLARRDCVAQGRPGVGRWAGDRDKRQGTHVRSGIGQEPEAQGSLLAESLPLTRHCTHNA